MLSLISDLESELIISIIAKPVCILLSGCSRPRSEVFYLAQHAKYRMTNIQKKWQKKCVCSSLLYVERHTHYLFLLRTHSSARCVREACMCGWIDRCWVGWCVYSIMSRYNNASAMYILEHVHDERERPAIPVAK